MQSPSGDVTIVMANYTKLSENIRRLTPHGIQCSIFCGGTNCKYENPENWKADSLALKGIYSHWITDNILAMARPSTAVIIKKNIIQQFQSLGIKSIINLQCPKEHASCGEPLEDSGFSYEPNIFMENNIYYYNFNWKDYGDATLSELLNMVKVVAFATTEGRVAIHCHAGLGRTGVLIACYLVYSLRVPGNDAIKYVRLKRPGSVQTRGQITCVRHFAQFILPQSITYYVKESQEKYITDFTLQRFLKRQKIILHGYEERNFKYLPKIIHVICERILQLCGCYTDEYKTSSTPITSDFLYTKLNGDLQRHESIYSLPNTLAECTLLSPDSGAILLPDVSYAISTFPISPSLSESDDSVETSQLSGSYSDLSNLDGEEIQTELAEQLLSENKCFQELQLQKSLDREFAPDKIYGINDVVASFLINNETINEQNKQVILQYKLEINTSQHGWDRLKGETNMDVLMILLFEWIENLKLPILGKDNLENIVINYRQPESCFKKFAMEEAYLIEYLLHFITKIRPVLMEDQDNILQRIIASLAQQIIVIKTASFPSGKGFQRFREGTLKCTTLFFKSLLLLIETHHNLQTFSSDDGSSRN